MGAASDLCGVICGDGGVLGLPAEAGQEEGVGWFGAVDAFQLFSGAVVIDTGNVDAHRSKDINYLMLFHTIKVFATLLARVRIRPFCSHILGSRNWLTSLNIIEMAADITQPDVIRLASVPQKVHGEANVEWIGRLDGLDVFRRQPQAERFDIALQMIDLPSTDDGKDIRRLVHDIRQRHARESSPMRLPHLLQRIRYGRIVRRRRPRPALPLHLLALLSRLETAATEGAPGGHAHPLGCAHVDDIALEVPIARGPATLVNDELAQAMVAGVLVGLAHHPGGGVGDAEVEHFALADDVVEALHELGDADGEVPPVHIENIQVVGLQLLQAVAEGEMQGFGAVAGEVAVDDFTMAAVVGVAGGELGGDDHLVAQAAGGHPFADPLLRLLGLVVVGGVDEIASLLVEIVEKRECVVFADWAHELP